MESPILLYDGKCALCNFFVRLILRFDSKRIFKLASLDSDFALSKIRDLQIPENIDSVIMIQGEQFWLEHEAFFAILRQLNYPMKALLIFQVLPDALNRSLYKLIARNRYSWFGKYDTCPLPPADKRSQFIS